MTTSVLDPTNEQTPEHRERAQRISSLQRATIGLLDISKPRGDVFLDTIQSLLEKKAPLFSATSNLLSPNLPQWTFGMRSQLHAMQLLRR